MVGNRKFRYFQSRIQTCSCIVNFHCHASFVVSEHLLPTPTSLQPLWDTFLPRKGLTAKTACLQKVCHRKNRRMCQSSTLSGAILLWKPMATSLNDVYPPEQKLTWQWNIHPFKIDFWVKMGICQWLLWNVLDSPPSSGRRHPANPLPPAAFQIPWGRPSCALSFMAWHWRQIRNSRISMRGPRLRLRFHEGGMDGVERHLDDKVVRPKVRHDAWCMDVYICLHSGLTLRFLRGERVWRTICCSCVLSQFHWWSAACPLLRPLMQSLDAPDTSSTSWPCKPQSPKCKRSRPDLVMSPVRRTVGCQSFTAMRSFSLPVLLSLPLRRSTLSKTNISPENWPKPPKENLSSNHIFLVKG